MFHISILLQKVFKLWTENIKYALESYTNRNMVGILIFTFLGII